MSHTEEPQESFGDYLIRKAVRAIAVSAIAAIAGPFVAIVAAVASGDDVGDIL